jgi:patatin-like phospholipase/acyl hydrolase
MRSYDGPFRIDGLTIWQATRATSAAPTFFERLEIGTNEFIDRGMGSNNPSKTLLNETQRLFKQDHDRTLACIIELA